MKKFMCLFLGAVCAAALSGCGSGSGGAESGSYNYKTDCQLASSLSGVEHNIAKCETGYYTLVGKKIYYIERETMQATLLCNKPNCLHNDDTCNAWVGAVDSISYSDGYIYYISEAEDEHEFVGSYLVQMSADGSERKNILYMETSPTDWIIHRGNFYYGVQKYKLDEDTGLENVNYADCYIYSYPTDSSKSQPKEIYFAEEIQQDAQITGLMAYGDNIYFEIYGMRRDNKTEEVRKSLKLNLEDFTVSEMLSSTGYSLSQPMYLDEMLIFSTGESENGKYVYYKTDFDGNNPEKFFETYEGESVVCDGTYLYVDNYYTLLMPQVFPEDDPVNRKERYITVYDSKLNKIDEFSLGDGSAKTWNLLPVDDEMFIFGGQNAGDDLIFYYDKSKFGTLNGELWEKTFCYREDESEN